MLAGAQNLRGLSDVRDPRPNRVLDPHLDGKEPDPFALLHPTTPAMSTYASQSLAPANAAYVASFGAKGALAMPPAKKLAFVVCMDARIDPAAAFGLKEGDAHVIRNAGGRVVEAIRSLVISQELLGTREIVVVHHTLVASRSSARCAR